MTDAEDALVEVGRMLRATGYRFTVPTPETHARVLARGGVARDLRDAFGWNRPVRPALLAPEMLAALRTANAIREHGDVLEIRVRFATLGAGLYLHSGYPTTHSDSVFFGPDTYRFCALLSREVTSARRVVDIGGGCGVGGLVLADRAERIVITDINDRALSCARINAALAGVSARVELASGDVLAGVTGAFDLAISNPPYLVDPNGRSYCHGGEQLGTALAVRIVTDALARLAPGGRLILYTGSPIKRGSDMVHDAVAPILDRRGAHWTYAELDPDVFGEQLEHTAYADAEVERIAAVALCATLP